MDKKERVYKAMSRTGKPDRIPFEISWGAFTPILYKTFLEKTGTSLTPDEYFDFDTRYIRPLPSNRKYDHSSNYADQVLDGVSFDEWGIGSVPTRFEIPDYKFHPLARMETVRQIEDFCWPDLDCEYRYAPLKQTVDAYHQQGNAVCADMYQTVFETAWLLRGMEDFLSDFYLNPELVEAIIAKLTNLRIEQAKHFAKIGVDIIRLGDDVLTQQGLMMSKETYRTFLKPGIRRIVDVVKRINPSILVFMHSCGKVEEIVPDYIDCGIDILNPIQPECNDLEYIERNFGKDIAFWGGIGVQSIMPFGTPADVKKEVFRTQKILGRNGHWLAAPAHILDPTIPWENVIAFVEAVRESSY